MKCVINFVSLLKMFSLSKKMQEINFISAHKFLVSALQQTWTAVYTKIIAISLLYGATVHVGNIYGLTGTPWLNTPLQGAIARYYSFDLRHSNRDLAKRGTA